MEFLLKSLLEHDTCFPHLFCSRQKLKMWSLLKTSSGFSPAREEGQITESQSSIIVTFLIAVLCMHAYAKCYTSVNNINIVMKAVMNSL